MSFRTVNGNTHTEDGWRCVNRDECDIVRIPDLFLTDTAPIRKGAPLTILGAWLFWYDRNVEEITTSIWGWSESNDVLGQPGRNNGSNHLGGTAVDVNAPKYPWGLYRMPADKIAKVEEGLRLFEDTVFWGRAWDSRPDEMHYQMHFPEGDTRNEAFAQKLLGGYLGIYKQVPSTPAAADVLARATGLTLDRAAQILPEVQDGLHASECTNPNRIAMWLAQVGHESDNFNATEEYADGDGGATERWIYKGRTWIQLTWSANYDGFSKWCFGRGLVPTASYFVDSPKLLADLKWAGLGAAWYWTVARPQINGLCDARDLIGVTKAINGGTNGLEDSNGKPGRRTRYNNALALGDQLLQLLTDGDDDMFNDSDRELLRQIAEIRRKSLSPFRWPFEGEVNTCVGFAWTADANTHIQLVEKLAVIYGDPQSIAMLLAVSRTNEPGRVEDAALAARVLNRVTDAGKALGETWLASHNVKVTA